MQCPNCGSQVEPNDAFCGECGQKLENMHKLLMMLKKIFLKHSLIKVKLLLRHLNMDRMKQVHLQPMHINKMNILSHHKIHSHINVLRLNQHLHINITHMIHQRINQTINNRHNKIINNLISLVIKQKKSRKKVKVSLKVLL